MRGWETKMPFVNNFEDTGDLPAPPFWEHLKTLAAFDAGRENVDPEPALEYFGYRFVTEGVEHGPYETEYVRGHFRIDERGMGARPEWVLVDRATVGHRIVEVTAALRGVIQVIRADNAQGPDAIMEDLERKQLIITLESALRELTDAAYTNKNALWGIVGWMAKLSAKAGEKYLSSALVEALNFAGHKLLELLTYLPAGGVKLPW
jgi:hypothetical protein